MSGDIKRKCCLIPAKLFTFGHICSALPLSFNHLLVTSCSNHSTARRNDINVNRPFSECAFKKEREKRKTWWSKNLSLLEFLQILYFVAKKNTYVWRVTLGAQLYLWRMNSCQTRHDRWTRERWKKCVQLFRSDLIFLISSILFIWLWTFYGNKYWYL